MELGRELKSSTLKPNVLSSQLQPSPVLSTCLGPWAGCRKNQPQRFLSDSREDSQIVWSCPLRMWDGTMA